jgi:hypothetical protein
MLSCQQTQNVIDGKKRIILNPSESQKRDFEAANFAEGEVYGIDILISSGEDGKVCPTEFLSPIRNTHQVSQARLEESRTTLFQRDPTVTYQLKAKNSRAVFSEVQKKAGSFPFNILTLEDEKRARMGLQEAVQHSLVKPYEVMYVIFYSTLNNLLESSNFSFPISYTPSNTFVAGFHFTIALLPGGPSLITQPPIWYKLDVVKTEKEVEDVRESRNSKKAKKTEKGEADAKDK